MSSDDGLVHRARDGSKSAFDELVQRHSPMVRRIVRSFASIEEDVNDLVQETFITAHDRLHQLADPDRFACWLSAIARNECRQWLRRRLTQPTLLPLAEEDGASGPQATITARAAREAARRGAIREAISDALAALDHSQQRVVRMHYLEGYDYRETAELLSVPVSVVRGRLDRARNTLRKELKEMVASKESWELKQRDLDILRFAAGCVVERSSEHPASGVLFTGDGSFVCTDTHRLLHYTSASLKTVPRAVVHADLARGLRCKYADACKGRLTFGDEEVRLKLHGGDEIKAALVTDKEYPNWSKIVPKDWRMSIRAQCGQWLQALQLLALHRVMQPDASAPNRVLLVLSPEEKRIILRQQGPVPARKLGSEMSVWFPAEFSTGGPDVKMWFNARYLEEAVSVLGLGQDEIVELRANSELESVLARPAKSNGVWVLTMPMQGPPHDTPESKEAAAAATAGT